MQRSEGDAENTDTVAAESESKPDQPSLAPQISPSIVVRRRLRPHRSPKTKLPSPKTVPQPRRAPNVQGRIRESNLPPAVSQIERGSAKQVIQVPQYASQGAQSLTRPDVADNGWWERMPGLGADLWRFVIDTLVDVTRSTFIVLKQPLKLILVVYLVVLLVSHASSMLWRGLETSLRPVCSLPYAAKALPFCTFTDLDNRKPPLINFAKTSEAQLELDRVMKDAGQGAGLALSMKSVEHAVRDLAVKVRVSNLASKEEMGVKLDSFITGARTTARDLSRFNAKVARVVDTIIANDNHALRILQSIRARQGTRKTPRSRFLHAIFPFGNFVSAHDEATIRKIFVQMASTMSDHILPLVEYAEYLIQRLESLATDLFAIDDLVAIEEKLGKDLDPATRQQAILSLLWERLSGKYGSDLAAFENHKTLLLLVTSYRLRALEVIRAALAALSDMQGDLEEFRDIHAMQALVEGDLPLEVHMEGIRLSLERLKAGRLEMGRSMVQYPTVQGTVPP